MKIAPCSTGGGQCGLATQALLKTVRATELAGRDAAKLATCAETLGLLAGARRAGGVDLTDLAAAIDGVVTAPGAIPPELIAAPPAGLEVVVRAPGRSTLVGDDLILDGSDAHGTVSGPRTDGAHPGVTLSLEVCDARQA